MEPLITHNNLPVPVIIAAPRSTDGTGSALRRAFPAPGALPYDLLKLLRDLDCNISHSVD